MRNNTELDLFPNKTFSFKGKTLTTGDVLSIKSKSLPIEVQLAFTHVDNEGNLDCFSTLIAPFKHNGLFSPEDITDIEILYSGQESISKESRNPSLEYGRNVATDVKGKIKEGVLIAAFDGIVAAWSKEDGFISGGSSFFSPA